MELGFQFLKGYWQIERRRWVLVVGVVAITYVLFQSLLLPYGNALRSMVPRSDDSVYSFAGVPVLEASVKSPAVRNALAVEALYLLSNGSRGGGVVEGVAPLDGEGDGIGGDDENRVGVEDEGGVDPIDNVMDRDVDDDEDEDVGVVPEDVVGKDESLVTDGVSGREGGHVVELAGVGGRASVDERDASLNLSAPTGKFAGVGAHVAEEKPEPETTATGSPSVESSTAVIATKATSSRSEQTSSATAAALENNATIVANVGRKKLRCDMPPKSITTIDEMNRILARHRRSSRAMRPRWSSNLDQEIVTARSQIDHALLVVNDRDLYAPLFRNVSRFKRSYELMEQILKIYTYKEGKRPIFHVPILKGLYASEGWFMKLLRESKRFNVKDPKKAHLFYMPFSSRMLEHILYVRNSHNRTNLRQHMKEYSEKIASKYPYWNRTGGADHFLVACHDWAPYETRHHMEHCIKALCNADVTAGFKIGRDISLPETYVRSARNPLRDLGGKPPSQRRTLAFYAGNIHGYLRPILLKHWEDKDPDVKIFGPMPPGVASKMSYIQHMKSSKYCICPKGYEVNSPRVVESIFYECVPVIISDNFVPPFFEVLDWTAFSLILAEKDIPNLKEILLSIPEEKYRRMQLGVRRVQPHFLWHPKPIKYDLFHMTLHSIWYNRVYQIKPR